MFPCHLRRFLATSLSVVAGAVVAGCAAEPSPETAVRGFLLEWQAGDYEAAARYTSAEGTEAAEALRQAHDQLDLAALRLSLGPIRRDGQNAVASYGAEADLGIGDPVWSYDGEMSLSRVGGEWIIDWSPSVIHPELDEGERLAVTYEVPERGRILDRDGEPLVDEVDVVALGVRPTDMADVAEGVRRFAELLDQEAEPLLNRVRSAPPTEFHPLVLTRKKDLDPQLRERVTEIPGVESTETTMPLTPTLAPSLVGEVAGTREHNVTSRISGPYQAGDTMGLGGLQSVFQQRLAGSATTKVVTLDEGGENTRSLHEWPGQESTRLRTTLDATMQDAAEGALATVPTTAHMVAVDAATGEVRVVAGHPAGVDNEGALTRAYPPGEAFTIVSTAAMLASGDVTPERAVRCEPEITVDDRVFTNHGDVALWGEPELTRNFADACATAFADLAGTVDAQQLTQAASEFGIGGEWHLPVPAHTGEFTAPTTRAETAAAVVGADRVTVSPLNMALAAGAVADGTWRSPRLLGEDGATRDATETRLDTRAVEGLRTMMRAAVADGSARSADVGVLPVAGQVGRAEQRIEGEDRAVQWFVGYQGNIAFAAAVEVDPATEYQYALGAVSDFLQRLPPEAVRPLPHQEESVAESDMVSSTGAGF